MLLGELGLIGAGSAGPEVAAQAAAKAGLHPIPPLDVTTNTRALGELIYTHYIFLFQMAGMVLLVAMIGAIVLTHRTRKGVRKPNISAQIVRRAEETI